MGMRNIIIDGGNILPTPIVTPPLCPGDGKCVLISNNSPADTIYYGSDQSALQTAKQANTPNVGTPILAGAQIVIPWVTSGLWAINYATGPTPTDVINVEDWE